MKYKLFLEELSVKKIQQNGYKAWFLRYMDVIFRINIVFNCISCFLGSKNYCQVSSLGKRIDGRQ